MRVVLALIFFATIVVVFGGYVIPRLFPLLRWPQAVLFTYLSWIFARFVPSVWGNRTDDKMGVVFVVSLILIFLWNAWSLITGQ